MAEETVVPEAVLFLIMSIFAGGTVLIVLQSRYEYLANIPYTVAMFIYGMVVGAVLPQFLPDATSILSEIPPRLIFHIFLPVLIFEGSYGMKIHALGQVIHQVILLATVGLLINTVLLAGPAMLCFPSWSIYTAMLFGSLLSATDPVAVVSLLKGLGVDKRITALVDGEAIMNDGTAIITYTLFFPAALAGRWVTPFSDFVIIIAKCSVVAYAFGTACGMVQAFALRRTGDGLVQACMTVAFTYVAYYIADVFIETSPVLVMLFQGIYLSTYYPSLFPGSSAHGHSVIHTTWEFLVHLGNTVLFSLVGIIVVANITITYVDIFKIIIIYLAMMCGRFVMICMLRPLLNLRRFQLHMKEVLLLTHGGLRGGVATALALGLFQADNFSEGADILKVTAGVVGLTLLINATTAAPVVTKLGLKKKPKHRIFQMEYAMKFVKTEGLRELSKSKGDATLQFASFGSVAAFVEGAQSPYVGAKISDESDDVMVNSLLMNAFKSGIWRLRDEDSIPETTVRRLAELASRCLFRKTLLKAMEVVDECCLPPLWFRVARPFVAGMPLLNSWCDSYVRRHNRNYFLMLLSCAEVFDLVDHIKRQYVTSERSMHRVSQWINNEKEELQKEIDCIGHSMRHTRRQVATARAARRSIRAMDHAVDSLHEEHGFSVPIINDLRAAVAALKSSADNLCDEARSDMDLNNDAPLSDVRLVVSESPLAKPAVPVSLHDDLMELHAAAPAPLAGVASVTTTKDAPPSHEVSDTAFSISTCLGAIRGSVLGMDLSDDELRVLIGHSRLKRLRAGSTWERPSDSPVFFLVISGVVESAWDERGSSSVLHASYALRYLATLSAESRVMTPTTSVSDDVSMQRNFSPSAKSHAAQSGLYPTFFPSTFSAKTDVSLLEFSFRDFVDMDRGGSSNASATASSSLGMMDPTGSSLLNLANTSFVGGMNSTLANVAVQQYANIVNHFWRAVAAEALLPYVASQHCGPNSEPVTPFLLSRAGRIIIVEEDRSPIRSTHRVSQDLFVIHGEDTSGMYLTEGYPIPVPKTTVHHVRWLRGTVIYALELPFFKASDVVTMDQWFNAGDIISSQSATYDESSSPTHMAPHEEESSIMLEPLTTASWKDLMFELLGNADTPAAHIVPSNIRSLNAMHTGLFCAIERVAIATCQMQQRLGDVTELRAVLRMCTDEAIRMVMDYCCRVEDLIMIHDNKLQFFVPAVVEEAPSLGQLTSVMVQSPGRGLLLNHERFFDVLRHLRRDVCMWTSSRMIMYGEQERVALNMSKRISKFLVDIVACSEEESGAKDALDFGAVATPLHR